MKSITQVVQNLLKPYIDNKDKAYAGNIAPVEVSPAEAAHATGTQLIYNSVLYDVTAPIAIGDALATSGVGANISVADDISTQIKNHTVTTDAVPTKNSTNPVQSGGVYSAESNIYAVMGKNGAKNLNSYPYVDASKTSNGITFTDNGDGTITANGTATAYVSYYCHLRLQDSINKIVVPNGRYILSGCPSGGSVSTYRVLVNRTNNGAADDMAFDYGEGVEVTLNGDDYSDNSVTLGVLIGVYNGATLNNVVFKPMLRLASDTDSTYQPYAKTNQQLTAENEALTKEVTDIYTVMGKQGAKNILDNIASTNTVNDVLFTVNSDKSVTISGTPASGDTVFGLSDGMQEHLLPEGQYILSDGEHTDNVYTVVARKKGAAGTTNYDIKSKGTMPFTVDYSEYDYFNVYLYVSSAEVGNTLNLTLYPMIRQAEDSNDTYQPYAKTNQKLTAENQTLTKYANSQCNPNLLDNPWFTVNQRGVELPFASGTAQTYFIDRWYTARTNITSLTDGVTFKWDETNGNNGWIQQKLPIENKDLIGKTVTLSAIINNELFVLTGQIPTVYAQDLRVTFDDIYLGITNMVTGTPTAAFSVVVGTMPNVTKTFTVKAVKLEFGSVSTLAMDTAPNSATELLKCQRYFIRLSGTANSSMIAGYSFATNYARFPIPMPTEMRTLPTLAYSDLADWGASKNTAANAFTCTSIAIVGRINNVLMLQMGKTDSFTAESHYQLCQLTDGAYLDFSADL